MIHDKCTCALTDGDFTCPVYRIVTNARRHAICRGLHPDTGEQMPEEWRAQHEAKWIAAGERLKAEAPIVQLKPLGGPGTELKAILASLGIKPGPECECNKRAAEMDRRGIEGCKATRDEVIGWLRDSQQRYGWGTAITAGAKALLSGLALRLNPLDPIPGLVDEAIRRAEEKRG